MEGTRKGFVDRFENIDEPEQAARLHDDLLKLRHDLFGQSICAALQIRYNNDMTYDKIREYLNSNGIPAPKLDIKYTPDNVYVNSDGEVFIIDYKVSASKEYYESTLRKYELGFSILKQSIQNKVYIVLLVLNPRDYTVYCSHDKFMKTFFGQDHPDYYSQIGWINSILSDIDDAYGSDEVFRNVKNYESFDFTEPWTKKSVSYELSNDPNFINFIKTLKEEERNLFFEFLNFDLDKNTQKDVDELFFKCENIFKKDVALEKEKIKSQIKSGDLLSKTPTLEKINDAWVLLEENLKGKKQLHGDVFNAKPSVHMLWSKDFKILDGLCSNFTKMLSFGKIFTKITLNNPGNDPIGSFLKNRLGCMLDLSLHVNAYAKAVDAQKSHDKTKTRKAIQVGNAFIYHDQQFLIPACPERKELYRHAHIGEYPKFKNRADEAVELEQPMMLNPFDKFVNVMCKNLIEGTKEVLSNRTSKQYKKHAVSGYLEKIQNSMQPDAFEKLQHALESDYYKFLVDSSQLMKGALSMSEVTYPNTVRLIYSASSSTMLILLPSSKIETARASICYFTVTVHKEKLAYTGCEHETYAVEDFKVTASRIIRLDKERCKKIVEAPNLFLLLCATFINNNPKENIVEIMNYCFYMSMNVTKSVMSLTEPGRYLIMGASSLSCNVDEYIFDKLDPITKSVFSVYLFNKLKKATELAHTELKELLAAEIILEADALVSRGPSKIPSIKSVWFNEKINLESYITEVFLPFYINQKGLHYYHHNILALSKVPLDIEFANKLKESTNNAYWSDVNSDSQHINVPVFMSYLAKYHIKHKNKFNQFRTNLENKAGFKKMPHLIKTLTSSKSCIKIGDFSELKTQKKHKQTKHKEQEAKKKRVIASQHVSDKKSNILFTSSKLLNTNGYLKFVIVNTVGFITDEVARENLNDCGIYLPLSKKELEQDFNMEHNGSTIRFLVIDDNMPIEQKIETLFHKMAHTIKVFEPPGIAIRNFEYMGLHPENAKIVHRDIVWEFRKLNIEIPYVVCTNDEFDRPFTMTVNTGDILINKNVTLLSHADYTDVKMNIPNYIDYITTKIYDQLYEISKKGVEINLIDMVFESIRNKKDYYFTLFPKEQRTAVDREIYEGEYESKLALYVIERIYREMCRVDLDEMISQPGDTKMINIEKNRESHLYEAIKRGNMTNSCLIEINADMSKFSAQDITYKYIFCIAMNPILYQEEKEHLILFLCKYMRKKLLIPDAVLMKILDQREGREDDIFFKMTDNLDRNWVEIGQNWLQGNLNYIASFVHSVGILFVNDTIKEYYSERQVDVVPKPLVHSDDLQEAFLLVTKQIVIKEKIDVDKSAFVYMDEEEEACRIITMMKLGLLKFGLLLNSKKTYASKYIKEFVSLHNLNGQPFSVYSRFLFPCVGSCAFMGPYEDLSARLSGIRTAAQHGAPPGLLWLAVSISTHCTYETYSMLPDQKNDPLKVFDQVPNRFVLPLELGGYPNFEMPTFILLGSEAHDLKNLSFILKNCCIELKEGLLSQESMNTLNMSKLSAANIFYLRAIYKFCMLQDLDVDSSVGETYEMRSRSVITPKRFTTLRLIRKLVSYKNFKDMTLVDQKENLMYMLKNPQLLVTKASNNLEFKNLVLFRYYSRTFKESLSLQSPVQLFIEQILHSSRPCVDREFLDKFTRDHYDDLEHDQNQLIGRLTIVQAMERVNYALSQVKLTKDVVEMVVKHKLLNDPLVLTLANAENTMTIRNIRPRKGFYTSKMPQIRVIRSVTHTPAEIIKRTTELIKNGRIKENEINVVQQSEKKTLLETDCQVLVNYLYPLGHISTLVTLLTGNKEYDDLDNTSLRNDLSDICKILQISYQFLSQVGNLKKSIILENRVAGAIPDFLRNVYGCFLKDGTFFDVDFSKNVICPSTKGYIMSGPTVSYQIACKCYKAICLFLDKYIQPEHRISLLKKIVNEFSYNGYAMMELLDSIHKRYNPDSEFHALLYHMKKLDDADILRVLSKKSTVKTTWHKEQEVRHAMLGSYSVSYDASIIQLQIEGTNRRLNNVYCTYSSEYFNPREKAIITCLNKFSRDIDISCLESTTEELEGKYVLYREKKGYFGLRLTVERFKPSMKRDDIVAVITLVKAEEKQTDVENIKILNNEKLSLRHFYINPTSTLVTRRADLVVLGSLKGPELSVSNISMNMLLANAKCLSNRFDPVNETNIFNLSEIFCCQNTSSETLDKNNILNEAVFTFDDVDIDININIKSIIKSKVESDLSIKQNVVDMYNDLIDWYKNLLDPISTDFERKLEYFMKLLNLLKFLNVENKESRLLSHALHTICLSCSKHRYFHSYILPADLIRIDGSLNEIEAYAITLVRDIYTNKFWDPLLTKLKNMLRESITDYCKNYIPPPKEEPGLVTRIYNYVSNWGEEMERHDLEEARRAEEESKKISLLYQLLENPAGSAMYLNEQGRSDDASNSDYDPYDEMFD